MSSPRKAQDAGAFETQIMPVFTDGEPVVADEGVRRGTTVEKLAGLKPAFKEDGVIHAGNSSQISDGAAALLVTTAENAVATGPDADRPVSRGRRHRGRSGADADRSDSGHREGAAQGRCRIRRGRRVRGQRGVRAGAAGVAGRNRRRRRQTQPAGRGDRARPSARRVGRGPDDAHDQSHARQRNSLRPADHVRGRRHRQRHAGRTHLR